MSIHEFRFGPRTHYPLLGQRRHLGHPEHWVNSTEPGRKMIEVATKQQQELKKDPNLWGSFLKGAFAGTVGSLGGELLGILGDAAIPMEGMMESFTDGMVTALGDSVHVMAATTIPSATRAKHSLLPLFLEQAPKTLEETSDSIKGRTAYGWYNALNSTLSKYFGKNQFTVMMEARPTEMNKKYQGFDFVVAVHELGHAIAIEIDEPVTANGLKRIHTLPWQRKIDDDKDYEAGYLGLPVLRLAEKQIADQPRSALGLCLKFLECRTGLKIPDAAYQEYNWQRLQKLPRFGTTGEDDLGRVPSGWSPNLAF